MLPHPEPIKREAYIWQSHERSKTYGIEMTDCQITEQLFEDDVSLS